MDGTDIAQCGCCNGNEMAMRSAKKSTASLADDILEYLGRHEQANDSIEGIVAWWLPLQRMEHAIHDVEAVLHRLVAQEFLVAREGPDGRMHYRLNAKMKPAIRHRLTANSRRRAG